MRLEFLDHIHTLLSSCLMLCNLGADGVTTTNPIGPSRK